MNQTPMMKQYLKMKQEHNDKIILFRVGDFYEMFFDDAKLAAKELNLTLTSKDVGKDNPVPLAGVPVHAVDNYMARLLKNGHKIAICDQVEDPAQAKGLVRREITRVVTPGTVTEENILDEKSNNFFMVIFSHENTFGFAYIDVSTGEFQAGEHKGSDALQKIKDEFHRLRPSEVLADQNSYQLLEKEHEFLEKCIFPDEKNIYFSSYKSSVQILASRFTQFLEKDFPGENAVIAAAAAFRYLSSLQKNYLKHINKLTYCISDSFMFLDNTTVKNLEILTTIKERKKEGTLLSVLDFTATAMGGRMLKNWLLRPLNNYKSIEQRQLSIHFLKNNESILSSTRKTLQDIYDLERLTSRLTMGHVSPRDLLALKNSLKKIPPLKDKFKNAPGTFAKIIPSFPNLHELVDLIDRAIDEQAPLSVKEGNIIKPGYDREIDRLRDIKNRSKSWLLDLEKQERENTGIKSLKVSYNKVFGYYIEVTKPNLSQIPEHYFRKQTLVNAERFITEELKQYENEILGAQEKLYQIEHKTFEEIREKASLYSAQLQQAANVVGHIDCLCSLTSAALRYNYIRPVFNNQGKIKIKQGRHPVVEQASQAERFIPNDLEMDSNHKINIVTGPNMAGKSTFCRSMALIMLMAQMGGFVPAEQAELTLLDRIFARVGAADDLSTGKSTFMVEMQEITDILSSARDNSLILLDEIGRGTSTYDGMSLARAIIEYIHDRIKAYTLFSTHFHELTELEKEKELINNYYITVKEVDKDIVFLRKVIPGKTDKSYGINVARLAGLPEEIITRATLVLQSLEKTRESSWNAPTGQLKLMTKAENTENNDSKKPKKETLILEELRTLNLLEMTPLESLNKLYQLQKKLR